MKRSLQLEDGALVDIEGGDDVVSWGTYLGRTYRSFVERKEWNVGVWMLTHLQKPWKDQLGFGRFWCALACCLIPLAVSKKAAAIPAEKPAAVAVPRANAAAPVATPVVDAPDERLERIVGQVRDLRASLGVFGNKVESRLNRLEALVDRSSGSSSVPLEGSHLAWEFLDNEPGGDGI